MHNVASPMGESGSHPEQPSLVEVSDGERQFLEIVQELSVIGVAQFAEHRVSPERLANGFPEISSHYSFFQLTDDLKEELQRMYVDNAHLLAKHRHLGEWDVVGYDLLTAALGNQSVPVGLDVATFRQDSAMIDTLVIIRYTSGYHRGARGFYLDRQPLQPSEIGHIADTLKRTIVSVGRQPKNASLFAKQWSDQLNFYRGR